MDKILKTIKNKKIRDNEYFHNVGYKIIPKNEFFEIPEEEMKRIIAYDLMINVMKETISKRAINFYNYGDKKDMDFPLKVDEPEAIVRVGLSKFLRRVLGDLPSYSEGNYRLPTKYKEHRDLFRQEFWKYFVESYKSDFS